MQEKYYFSCTECEYVFLNAFKKGKNPAQKYFYNL